MDIWLFVSYDEAARKLLEQILFFIHKPLHNNYSNVKGRYPERVKPATEYLNYISDSLNRETWNGSDRRNFDDIVWKTKMT